MNLNVLYSVSFLPALRGLASFVAHQITVNEMVLCTVCFMPALRELADLQCAQCLFSIAFYNLAEWLKTTSKFMKRYADEGT